LKDLLSIGEMAQLHDTSVKTLRYYDEIGLLKPCQIDETTGYRYYSTSQFERLHTIDYLKFLGFPLKQISAHLESPNPISFLKLLREQQQATKEKIAELQTIHNRFGRRIEEIETALQVKEMNKPHLRYLPERRTICLKQKISSWPDMEVSLRKLEKLARIKASIFIGKVGLTVARENLLHSRFNDYNSILMFLEEPLDNEQLVKILPAGDYVCIYHRGNLANTGEYYPMLLEYIQEKNMEVCDDSIERVIIDSFVSRAKDCHLTEIQIPVRRLI